MDSLSRTSFDTPLGPMVALASSAGLCALEFVGPDRMHRLEARLRRWFPPHTIVDAGGELLDLTGRWLADYFDGASADSQSVPLDLRGAPFERRVWIELLNVAAGATSTYSQVASSLCRPKSARAVGAAVGSNPVSLIVPCHRIVGANGSLTGYGGGLARKEWLLRHEGRWRRGASNLNLPFPSASWSAPNAAHPGKR